MTNPGPLNWTSQGCYTDNVNGRAMAGYAIPQGSVNMTVTRCAQECWTLGYVYAGMEYADECCKQNYEAIEQN